MAHPVPPGRDGRRRWNAPALLVGLIFLALFSAGFAGFLLLWNTLR